RGLDLDAVDAEQLELHAGHRPGRVLRKRLVDPKRDLLAGNELAALEVVFEDRAREGSHTQSIPEPAARPGIQYRRSAPMPPPGAGWWRDRSAETVPPLASVRWTARSRPWSFS